MFEFFKSLFRPEKPSSETAKERLQLVLLSDHIALSPAIIESLKADLLAVISRYVEIDPEQADVTFEHRQREIAMLASIPIKGIREGGPGSAARQPEPAARQRAGGQRGGGLSRHARSAVPVARLGQRIGDQAQADGQHPDVLGQRGALLGRPQAMLAAHSRGPDIQAEQPRREGCQAGPSQRGGNDRQRRRRRWTGGSDRTQGASAG